MKNIVIRIAVCCLVIMTGCSKTVMSTDALSGIPRKIETIPVESALATLDNRIDELYGSFTRTTTKSYDISDVMSVDGEDLLGPSTKSSGVDIDGPLVYIVNFEGENGFAVISANTLFEEKIFCITEKGSMKTMGISPLLMLLILQLRLAGISRRIRKTGQCRMLKQMKIRYI